MPCVTFSIVIFVLTICFLQSESNKNCYKAKTCLHNGIERCGVDENGRPRLFLDLCDIHEFNCIQNTSFHITPRKRCFHLIDDFKNNTNTKVENNNNNNEDDNDDIKVFETKKSNSRAKKKN